MDNMYLTIELKNGNIRQFAPGEYTDYDFRGNAFVVMKGSRWVGLYNWEHVVEVNVWEEEEETK